MTGTCAAGVGITSWVNRARLSSMSANTNYGCVSRSGSTRPRWPSGRTGRIARQGRDQGRRLGRQVIERSSRAISTATGIGARKSPAHSRPGRGAVSAHPPRGAPVNGVRPGRNRPPSCAAAGPAGGQHRQRRLTQPGHQRSRPGRALPGPGAVVADVPSGTKAIDPRAVAAWGRPWDTKPVRPGRPVLWELWGVLSVLVGRHAHFRGALVMRRSWVRFPQAAPTKAQVNCLYFSCCAHPLTVRRPRGAHRGHKSSASRRLGFGSVVIGATLDEQVEPGGDVVQVIREQAGVDVERHPRRCVAEHALDRLYVGAGGHGQRCRSVP
jgi:hypothetical protein